jgi:hypothetical protein
VRGLASTLRTHKDELAALATAEMGKILAESAGEVEKSAWFCEYYADQAAELLAPRRIDGDQLENWVEQVPLGPIVAVMPWNFPYVQVFRFAPAMLVAGNVVLLKHAPNVPGCAVRIGELFTEAGFPEGTFETVLSDVDAVEQMLADPRVRGVTLTGSERAGSSVAAIAGRELKTSVLELGGSDPFVVLEDADIEKAAAGAVASRFTNAGQACINAKRLIVVEEVADAFEQAVIEKTAALRVGDPTDPSTQIGPLAQPRFAEALRAQVEESVGWVPRGLLGRPDRPHRRGQLDARVPRGDLRPGRGHRPRGRRGGRGGTGQRHRLRARRVRLDRRPRPRAGGRRQDRGRDGLRERGRRLRRATAVRRDEAQRLRARARALGTAGVHGGAIDRRDGGGLSGIRAFDATLPSGYSRHSP